MAQEVAALVARLEADTRDFQKGINKAAKGLKGLEDEGKKTRKGLGQTDKSMKGLTDAVKGFAIAAGVAFGAREVINFAKSTITAASDLGESINAVEVTFGDAAEGIKDLGVEAATAVGLSNAEFNTLAVGFAAFVDKIAEGGGSVVGVMEELTGRASDFASVMNIDVAEAATIFRSALAGETEPIRKFGKDLSAATVGIRALELGLADTTAELTEQDKILARYNLLMEQTEDVAGDFANTSTDLANATRTLTSTFENAKASIGDALIPTIEKLIPIAQKGIDLIIGWSIWLGRLTGAIDLVDGAVRRAKLGIDEEASAIEFLFEAMRKLDLEFGGIDEKAPLGDLFANLISENALQVDLLSKRFGNLAETFGLTADDAEFMRENAEELADEFKTTEDAVLSLADGLDRDLVKAMNNVAAKEGTKLLKNTQDIREAVLSGDRAFQGYESSLNDAAGAIEGLTAASLIAADPALTLISTTDAAAKAQSALNDARIEFGVGSAEFLAATDVALRATLSQNAAQRLFNEEFGPQSEETFRMLLSNAGVYGDELDLIVDSLLRMARAVRDLPPIPLTGRFRDPTRLVGHSGGTIPGPPGANVPLIAQAGETLRTVSQERALQNGGGGGGTTVIVQGFVGSELQLAAQIDKLLTRRSKTSKLGF